MQGLEAFLKEHQIFPDARHM